MPQAGLEKSPLDRTLVHVGFEERAIIAALFLGNQHRNARVLDESGGIGAVVRINPDPNARGNLQIMSRDEVWRAERVEYFLCAQGRVFSIGHGGQQYYEFIAALTADCIRFAHGSNETVGYRHQQLVAYGMSQ